LAVVDFGRHVPKHTDATVGLVVCEYGRVDPAVGAGAELKSEAEVETGTLRVHRTLD